MPSTALVNGYSFGGGLELALACTFRIAVSTARLALPEIKLGLIPAMAGRNACRGLSAKRAPSR